MNSEQLYPLFLTLIYWLVVILAIAFVSWLLSFLLPFIKTIAYHLTSKLHEKSSWAYQKGQAIVDSWLLPFFDQFKILLKQRSKSLIRSWIKEEEIRARFSRLDSTIAKLQTLSPVNPQDFDGIVNDLKAVDLSSQSRSIVKHVIQLLVFVIGLAVLISINTFLMSEFWSSLSPGLRTTIPALGITYSHVLALVFAILEILLGFLHYGVEPRDGEDHPPFHAIAKLGIWFLLAAFALVEAAAFARISFATQLATKLGASPDNPLYGLLNYILAPFGAGITVSLFFFGYFIREAIHGWIDARRNLAPLRELRKRTKQIESTAKLLHPQPEHSGQSQSTASQSLGTKMNELLDEVSNYTKRQNDLQNRDIQFTNAEMGAIAIRDLALLFIWGVLGFFSYYTALQALENLGLGTVATGTFPVSSVVAGIISVGTGVLGYFLIRSVSENYGSEQIVSNTLPLVNRIQVVFIILSLLSILTLVGVGLAKGLQTHWLTWLTGIIVLVLLFLLGLFLRNYLDAIFLTLRTLSTYFVSLLFLIFAFILTLFRFLVLLIYTLFSLTTIIGLAIRKYLFRSEDMPSIFPLSLIVLSLLSLNLSCGQLPPLSGTRIFYLFDITGSFQKPDRTGTTPLMASVRLAKKFVDELSIDQNLPGQFPQEHRIGYIGKEVIQIHGKDWFPISSAPNPFDPGAGTETFKAELDSVLRASPAEETDLYAGVYTAAEALKSAHITHKLLITFSDFDQTSKNPTSQAEIDLSGVKVILVYTETGLKKPDILKKDVKDFEEWLKQKGAKVVHSIHLISVTSIDILNTLREPE